MLHIAVARSWYMVPVTLNKLPSERIGVSFPTDQFAVQNLYEVWLDKNLFATMPAQDKATLLVHELVMGVRLLQYTDNLDQCLAKATADLFDPSRHDVYLTERKNCFADNYSVRGFGVGTVSIGGRASRLTIIPMIRTLCRVNRQ